MVLPTTSALTCVVQAWVLNSYHFLSEPNSGSFSSDSQQGKTNHLILSVGLDLWGQGSGGEQLWLERCVGGHIYVVAKMWAGLECLRRR